MDRYRADGRDRPPHSLWVRWMEHPDERVALRALSLLQELSAPRAAVCRAILYERASAEAAAEGVAWTPLLDALACRKRWPRRSEVEVRGAAGESREVQIRSIATHLAPLEHWLAQGPPDEALVGLARFQSPALLEAVARALPYLDGVARDSIFRSPARWQHLARSPHHTPERFQELSEALARGIEAEPEAPQHPEAILSLQRLHRAGFAVPASLVQAVVRHQGVEKPAALSFRASLDGLRLVGLSSLASTALRRAHYEAVKEARMGRFNTSDLERFLRGAWNHPEVVEWIRREMPDPRLPLLIASRRELRRERETRLWLRGQGNVDIDFELARDERGEGFRSSWQQLAARDPVRAAHLLEEARPEQRGALLAPDLQVLLAHPREEVRLRGVRTLASLGAGEAAPALSRRRR